LSKDFLLTQLFKGNKMATQTFKVAGITVHNGNAKVRFTDDMVRRVKQFTKGGASRCDFVELPSEMDKVEALKYLQSHSDFASAEDQALIADALVDKEKVANKGTVKVKVTKAKAPSIDAIKARGKKAKVSETTETTQA
jgi:hypothetical protein